LAALAFRDLRPVRLYDAEILDTSLDSWVSHARYVNAELDRRLPGGFESVAYRPPPLTGRRQRSLAVRDAVLVGDPPIPIVEGGMVLQDLLFRTEERFRSALSGQHPRVLVKALGRYRGLLQSHGDSRPPIVPAAETPGELHLLAYTKWKPFGHWVAEHLLTIAWLQIEGLLERVRIILEPNPPSWKLDSLRILGVQDGQITRWTPGIRTLDSLLVPEYAEVSEHPVSLLRRHDVRRPARLRRVYVSREDMFNRRIANEHAVKDYLIGKGFEEVKPERMSLEDQISLYQQAECVVGANGSAFSSQVFWRRGTRLIEFFGQSEVHLFNRQLSLALGMKHEYLLDPRGPTHTGAKDSSVMVDIDALDDVLSTTAT